MVANQVEEHVVALRALGEILFRVVDNMASTKRADHLNIAGAANTGHLRAEGLRDLHSKCANAARCAIDQNLLARLDLVFCRADIAIMSPQRHRGLPT